MSLQHIFSRGDMRSALMTTLGSDMQHAVAPYKAEILAIAQGLRGDVHRAAMRLLIERDGRRPSVMEQQLIIAALADLQGDGRPADVFDRAAARCANASGDWRELPALQQH